MTIFRRLAKEEGITGIETAIILIAFVVVASVFAYTVLSAGIFATGKSQQAILSGLQQAEGTMQLRGGIIAYKGDANIGSTVGKLAVSVMTMMGNQKIDLTPAYVLSGGSLSSSGLSHSAGIAYSDQYSQIADCVWTLTWVGQHTDDYLLENGEQAVITVWLHDYQSDAWQPGATPTFLGTSNLTDDQTFQLEIKPPAGAVIALERTMPPALDNVMDLH
jgi:archaeal flagellin FlaB